MGGDTFHRYWHGEICGGCSKGLPQPSRQCSWCLECRVAGIKLVLMYFVHYHDWNCAFLEEDACTHIGRVSRHKEAAGIDAIIARTLWPEEAVEEFRRSARAWGQGSVWLRLSREQYQRLQQHL